MKLDKMKSQVPDVGSQVELNPRFLATFPHRADYSGKVERIEGGRLARVRL